MLRRYKNTLVGKGSDLEAALSIKDKAESDRIAKKVYAETLARYEQLYPKEDRDWFLAKSFNGEKSHESLH